MSILKLRHKFTGYLVISVEGAATEKFINLAMRQGIKFWDVRQTPQSAVLKVDVDSFFDLRHLAKRTGCRVRILRKAGLPFLYSRLFRRRGLVAGLCFFVLTLYVLSSFVLFVGIEGNERLDEEYIRQLAAEAGVRPGLPKTQLDKDVVANRLILAEPDIAWVGIEVRGTRLIIEVVETIDPQVDMDTPGNVLAKKDGLVTDVLVISGEPRVSPGDIVTRGQILIEGVLQAQPKPPVEGEDGEEIYEEPPTVPVRARGEVLARVWYEGYGEASLTEIERERTGQSISVWTLVVDGQPVLRIGRQNVPYLDYEQETSNARVLERILRVAVEIITETTYEIERKKRHLSAEQALDLAAERARTLVELQLPVGVEVESVTVEEVELEQENLLGVRYVLETLENIAVQETDPGGD
ncbi:sporulation protein YqfD [Dethiobacter alkaliphilus]|uniref:sporulation protein YqfD n=1 Tax=Dethiobacter alkaliphilus TaxID=427926 RepID=UPI00222648D7|nr:sporulation protein YqfD [Dethiobacter alkaliphilus]MCW3489338.1 sporulation protein YqfD [Dethiobacter alkaliphilus]